MSPPAPNRTGAPSHRLARPRRSSCSARCRLATTSCPRRSASGRTRAGAARSSTSSPRGQASGSSTWRPAPGWSRPSCCGARTARWSGSTRARRCSLAPAARFAGEPAGRVELVEAAGRAAAVRRRELRRADASPTCCATSTIRPRRSRSSRASCGRAVASPRWSSACRRWRPRGRRGACTRRSGCRRSGASPRGSGRASGASSARASAASTRAHPLERIVGYWREAGLEDVRVRRMSLGGGIVMSAHAPGLSDGRAAAAARLLRAGRRAAGGRGDAAAPALHALAPQLLRDRRGSRAARLRQPAAVGAGGVRARGRRRRARARRAPRPPARDALQRPRPRACRGGERRGARSRSGSAGSSPSPYGSRRWSSRVRCCSRPTTSSWAAGASTAICGSRSGGARSPPSPATS